MSFPSRTHRRTGEDARASIVLWGSCEPSLPCGLRHRFKDFEFADDRNKAPKPSPEFLQLGILERGAPVSLRTPVTQQDKLARWRCIPVQGIAAVLLGCQHRQQFA